MNVILLDNVENLGSIGDLVKVKAGYGRNFLNTISLHKINDSIWIPIFPIDIFS